MALAPSLELKQVQQLAMTPQLQQAIKLLQMNYSELSEYLADQLASNPFLEVRETSGLPDPGLQRVAVRAGPRALADLDEIENLVAHISLHQHVCTQIGTQKLPAAIARAALLIASELGDDGCLHTPLPDLAARHGLVLAILEKALAQVQSCEPAGIGARNLSECLRLQLHDTGELDPGMQALLDNMPLLATNSLPALVRATGMAATEIAARLQRIRRLDPAPGARFAAPDAISVFPDMIVTRTASGAMKVELASSGLPRPLVNSAYVREIAASGADLAGPMATLSKHAHWLVRALDQRARTMLNVASAIVAHQERFFHNGAVALQPMTLKLIARQTGLHESTISRVTTGKFLSCDRGVFGLKSLFGSSVSGVDRKTAIASKSVRHSIGRLIAAEKPDHRLTDDRIVESLASDGIIIARRTVTKFRKQLRIPDSRQRQRTSQSRGKTV